jgi:hypothetical protein
MPRQLWRNCRLVSLISLEFASCGGLVLQLCQYIIQYTRAGPGIAAIAVQDAGLYAVESIEARLFPVLRRAAVASLYKVPFSRMAGFAVARPAAGR